MLHFQISLHGAEGREAPLAVTFDAVLATLEGLPRMFIEPDGSFVWTGATDGEPWQVDGNLIDRGDTLARIELQGRCPEATLRELLAAVGQPPESLAVVVPTRGERWTLAEFWMRAQRNE